MERYTIRAAYTADLDRIVALLLELQDHLEAANRALWRMSPESRANLKGQVASRLTAPRVRSLVAEHEEVGVVGVVFGRILTNSRYEPSRSGSIDQLIVRADHRRRGVARRLVAELCPFFSQEGALDISLRYVAGNEEAADFWSALGFAPRIVTAGARLDAVEARAGVSAEAAGA
jgi:GNAT superfamily N-acetyltransferase